MDYIRLLMETDRMERHMYRYFGRFFADLPVTQMQGLVLHYVTVGHESGSEVCQKDIEDELGLRGPSVTSLIDALVEKNLVRRERSALDGRRKCLIPTDEARHLAQSVAGLVEEYSRAVFRDVPPEELEVFERVVRKIFANVQT